MIELEQLLTYWNEIKGWVIGLGTAGVITLAFNVGLKLLQGRKVNVAIGFGQVYQKAQEEVNKKLLGIVSGVVEDYKDIKNDVKHVVAKADEVFEDSAKKVDALIELNVMLIGLLPMNANVKLKVKEIIDKIDSKYIANELLSVEEDSVVESTDPLDTILEDE